MGKTYRRDMSSVNGFNVTNATKIAKIRREKGSQNKPSKRYEYPTASKMGYGEDFSFYEAGNHGRGHKTFHGRNQTLNQRIRTILKRQFKNELNQELQDIENYGKDV